MFRLQGTYKKDRLPLLPPESESNRYDGKPLTTKEKMWLRSQNHRHDGTFDLTYSEEEGWSDPQSPILKKMQRDMGPSRPPEVRQYPLHSGQAHIPATLKGTDWQVASTVEAIIRTFAHDWKIEMDSPSEQTQEEAGLIR
jgi:hypothetical protein